MVIILDLLDFKSQMRLIFASKINKHLSKYWTITNKNHVNNKVLRWCYYDILSNIKIDELLNMYPKNLQRLTFGDDLMNQLKYTINSNIFMFRILL